MTPHVPRMTLATDADISAHEWAAVQDLLHDLQAEEDREHLAYLYGQWRLSIRAFRRVEARRMTAMEPTETDLLFHKACITDLMSFGTLLQIAAKNHADEELAKYGVRRDVVEAILRDLHNTFDEWHAQIPQDRVDHLSAAIFDAAPELNLSNPRA
jgi:hypothetical protein